MNNWNQIYNPLNGQYILLNSEKGHNILKNYLNQLMKLIKNKKLSGGSDTNLFQKKKIPT